MLTPINLSCTTCSSFQTTDFSDTRKLWRKNYVPQRTFLLISQYLPDGQVAGEWLSRMELFTVILFIYDLIHYYVHFICIISTYCINCMKWALALFEIELQHSAWEGRYVSTVTFSQSLCHVLQNNITRNLHSKHLLSAMLLEILPAASLTNFNTHLRYTLQICLNSDFRVLQD